MVSQKENKTIKQNIYLLFLLSTFVAKMPLNYLNSLREHFCQHLHLSLLFYNERKQKRKRDETIRKLHNVCTYTMKNLEVSSEEENSICLGSQPRSNSYSSLHFLHIFLNLIHSKLGYSYLTVLIFIRNHY